MSQSELHSTTGPGSPALSEEEQRRVDRIITAIQESPLQLDEQMRETIEWLGQDRAREKYPRMDRALPEMVLPGFGEPYTGDEGQIPCGAEIPHICEGCGHRVDVGRTCYRSTCPRCGPAWALRTAKGHVGRLHEAAKMMSSREGNRAVYKHHAIISPPPGTIVDADAGDPIDEAFHAVRDVLEAIGAEGFVYYHPLSGSQEHEDDRGKWKSRLFNDREWSDVREELEMRPHFHCVVATPHFPGGQVTKEIERQTGWVLHRITERNGSPVSLGDLEDVARAVTYCLSHTGIEARENGNYRAAMRCYGPAPHDCLPLDEETEELANYAANQAAPETLGLSTGSIECRQEVPEDERADLDDWQLENLDGDGDGNLEEDLTSTPATTGMVPCGCGLCSIDDADELLNDPEWCEQARYVDEARETKRAWDAAGGWQAWIGWEDDPPD